MRWADEKNLCKPTLHLDVFWVKMSEHTNFTFRQYLKVINAYLLVTLNCIDVRCLYCTKFVIFVTIHMSLLGAL